MKSGRLAALAVMLMTAFGTLQQAQAADAYPTRPITWVVGFAAGGATDSVVRLCAERLSKRLGQPVIVENRPGGGGVLGADFVAKSEPDGYTLFAADIGANAAVVHLQRDLPYDPRKAFTPISLLAKMHMVMVSPVTLKVDSVKTLIELSKSKPGELNYASSGAGGISHLAAELFLSETGLKMTHLPYRGGAQATPAVAGGQAQMYVAAIGTSKSLIDAGRLKPLAVTSEKRSPLLPNVPTMVELGLPNVVAFSWTGVVAPAGLPTEIRDRLSKELVEILNDPEIKERILQIGQEAVGTTPSDFQNFLQAETDRWGRVINTAGIKAE